MGTPWLTTWKAPQLRQASPIDSVAESEIERSMVGIGAASPAWWRLGRASGGWMYWEGTTGKPPLVTASTLDAVSMEIGDDVIFSFGIRLQHDPDLRKKDSYRNLQKYPQTINLFCEHTINLKKLQKHASCSSLKIRLMNFWGIALNGVLRQPKKPLLNALFCCID